MQKSCKIITLKMSEEPPTPTPVYEEIKSWVAAKETQVLQKKKNQTKPPNTTFVDTGNFKIKFRRQPPKASIYNKEENKKLNQATQITFHN